MLAVLLLQEGRPISYDGLVEAVWGGAPPVHVRNLVQKYVSGLRRALGDRVQLVWTGSGYQLAGIHADDLRRRRRLVDEAPAAREAGELRRAAELAKDAEELWRTPGRRSGESCRCTTVPIGGPYSADVRFTRGLRAEAHRGHAGLAVVPHRPAHRPGRASSG